MFLPKLKRYLNFLSYFIFFIMVFVFVLEYVPKSRLVCDFNCFQGLFLGSVGAANNIAVLKDLKITHILTVANSLSPTYPNDFTYKVVGGKNVFLMLNNIRY